MWQNERQSELIFSELLLSVRSVTEMYFTCTFEGKILKTDPAAVGICARRQNNIKRRNESVCLPISKGEIKKFRTNCTTTELYWKHSKGHLRTGTKDNYCTCFVEAEVKNVRANQIYFLNRTFFERNLSKLYNLKAVDQRNKAFNWVFQKWHIGQ